MGRGSSFLSKLCLVKLLLEKNKTWRDQRSDVNTGRTMYADVCMYVCMYVVYMVCVYVVCVCMVYVCVWYGGDVYMYVTCVCGVYVHI